MWKTEVQCSSKRSLKEGEGIPKQEYLVLNNIATLLNSKRMLNSLTRPKSIINNLTPNGYHILPYKLCEPPHLRSHPLGFPTSHNKSPSKTASYLHHGHSSITMLFDLVKVDLFNLLHPYSHSSAFNPTSICLSKLILVHIELFHRWFHSFSCMLLT